MQQIIVNKRDGRKVAFEREKIAHAMQKAFVQMQQDISSEELDALVRRVEQQIDGRGVVDVEQIQDLVELALMEADYFVVAKSYILYREERRRKRTIRNEICAYFPELPELDGILTDIETDYNAEQYSLLNLYHKFQSFYKSGRGLEERMNLLVKAAIELTDEDATRWEMIAGRFYGLLFQRRVDVAWRDVARSEKVDLPVAGEGDLSFARKVRAMQVLHLYGAQVPDSYTDEELKEAESWIRKDRDKLLNYSGYDLLVNRYVIHTHKNVPVETIQEMFLGIALFLARSEKNRLYWAKRFYDMLSTLRVTMATPTLANARKPYHQLSSCFIDTVLDDLRGIYRSISSFANISKYGGGMGLYFGKVRAQGASIRGFEGAAGGVIRWIRLANDTAVAVDQLGVRQGAVACYLDVWHKDMPEFLNLRTNNGDDRMKAHDVFPAVCYPDYFWQQVETNLNGQWGLLDPHEVLLKKGYALEDSFGEEWTERYQDCLEDDAISKRWIPLKELVRLIIRSEVETGTPFAFYRDAVNRANPNRHRGIIYCSNLCTEIAQNMSASEEVSEEIVTEEGDTVIVTKVRPGDFVVCNLASLNLGRINLEVDVPSHADSDRDAAQRPLGTIDLEEQTDLEWTTTTAVRALDNVIEENFFPVKNAQVTDSHYRPIGLGVSGYHHMLAHHRIAWESEEHLQFVDKVFENINYYAIRASHALAREKGAYAYFPGSDWQNGNYFRLRSYDSARWKKLAADVAKDGLRNGYLLAIAPTSSTSIVAGTSPGIDPIMDRFYYDEKKNGLIPRVAPDLSMGNYVYYKSAHTIDQSWSIRACGVRSRHIDQAQSMNLYITNDYTFRQILDLYVQAYHEGVKSIYYIRSKSLEVEECASCTL